jgi:hypothetical protein
MVVLVLIAHQLWQVVEEALDILDQQEMVAVLQAVVGYSHQ